MNPSPSFGLAEMGRRLLEDMAPVIQPGYSASEAGQIGIMLLGVAEKWDGAAHHLRAENRALVTLLVDAAALVGTPPPVTQDDDDIRISALTEINERLRSALIPVHAAVELLDTPEGRAMNDRIWDHLRASQARLGSAMDLF